MLFLPSIIYQIVLLCHFEYKKIYDKDCFLSKLHLLFNHGLYGIAIHRGWVHGFAPSPLPGSERLAANKTAKLLTLVYLFTETLLNQSPI